MSYIKTATRYQELEQNGKYREATNELIEEVRYNYERFVKKYGWDGEIEELYNKIRCRGLHETKIVSAQIQIFEYVKKTKEIFVNRVNNYDKGMDR